MVPRWMSEYRLYDIHAAYGDAFDGKKQSYVLKARVAATNLNVVGWDHPANQYSHIEIVYGLGIYLNAFPIWVEYDSPEAVANNSKGYTVTLSFIHDDCTPPSEGEA